MTRTLFITGYVLFILMAVAVEYAARSKRSEKPLATFDDVISYIQQSRVGRVTVFLVWFWLGFHFLAR